MVFYISQDKWTSNKQLRAIEVELLIAKELEDIKYRIPDAGQDLDKVPPFLKIDGVFCVKDQYQWSEALANYDKKIERKIPNFFFIRTISIIFCCLIGCQGIHQALYRSTSGTIITPCP